MNTPLTFDAHLDLGLNAIEWNRDLRLSVPEIRKLESGWTDLKGRGANTVAFPELKAGGVGLCVATQIAGCMKPKASVATWESPPQAWAMTQAQLAWYHAMEQEGQLRQIRDLKSLQNHLQSWEDDIESCPIGYILSLEGADSILTPQHLERAWESGLRAMGPAHYGAGRYALGHDQDGPLSKLGRDLIREMDRLGMILDVTHLCDRTFWDALDIFEGPVWASHSNCRALVDNPRQFSDEQIRALIERGAVIGAAFDAWMIVPDWIRGKSTPESTGVRLRHIVDHMDHICQLAGNANHIGIGS
ncbi:MAG: membrane dipeptidase, partial [Verrucomicrobiota bacterium]